MLAITVTEKGGEQRLLDYDKSQVTIGRVQGNDVILPKGNVSKRHARIVVKDDKFILVDLKSTNGTYVNGRKITSPLVVKKSDKIYIGDFILGIRESEGSAADGSTADAGPLETSVSAKPVAMPSVSRSVRSTKAGLPRPNSEPAATPVEAAVPPPRATSASMTEHVIAPQRGPSSAGPRASTNSPIATSIESTSDAPVAAPPLPLPRPPSSAPGQRSPRLVGRGASTMSEAQSRQTRPHALGSRRPVVVEPLSEERQKQLALQRSILDTVVGELKLADLSPSEPPTSDLTSQARSAIASAIEAMSASPASLPSFIDRARLEEDTLREAVGLGPLDELLADDEVGEIIVDRADRILVTRGGTLGGAGLAFSSEVALRRAVERLVARAGHEISNATPFIDIKLRDGSRLAAAVPPVAVRGACMTLRKPALASFSLADLLTQKAMSSEMADFLQMCVSARQNVIVCGAPSSGKTAVLTSLAAAAPVGERVVSVEEVAELSLDREGWIGLEARPGDGNGVATVDMEQLLRGALRMRPDRLVVADVRGSEAIELVSAMASSNDGTLVSVAGDNPSAALARLTTMSRLGAPGTSVGALRELIACAVDVIVHVARYADGAFRIASISEVSGVSEGGFQISELFSCNGSSEGGFVPRGVVPRFYAGLEARGIAADVSIFKG